MAKELLNNLVKQLHDAYDKEIVLKRDELGEKYEDFIDALDALYVNAIDSVVEAMLDKKVYSEFDPDVGDYVDVRDFETDEILFSIKISPLITNKEIIYRPLRDVVKDTVEAIKGYKSTQ